MQAAFAKLMVKNPVQSSHIDFRSGGNGVPILTRASGQSTAGYQTMGNSVGTTTLGAIRMGDDDGNGPGSAIFPGMIFQPYGQPDRIYPGVTFAATGNTVFQPPADDRGTIALLQKYGDQKFKATEQAPFEDYLAQQRNARDAMEASRNGSLAELGASRDILRHLSAQRRIQNEEDYVRRILDAGGSPEAAQKEIQAVRDASAIQEAKNRTLDDRDYQAKSLIMRMAQARGVTPMVREPLSQSAAINSPQPSQAMSQAMGVDGGYGTAPLDANREYKTADYYRKYLRRSTISQEAGDEQAAFNNLISQGELPEPPTGSYSMPMMRGQERQQQMEMASEALASRVDAIRQRAVKIKYPLPKPVFGKDILDTLYRSKGKSEGDRVLYSPETIQDLNPLQLVLAINWTIQHDANGFNRVRKEVQKYNWGTEQKPSERWVSDLQKVAFNLNKESQDIRIPFPNATVPFKAGSFISMLNDLKTTKSPEFRKDIEKGRVELMRNILDDEIPMSKLETLILKKPSAPQAPPATAPPAAAALAAAVEEPAAAMPPVAKKRLKVKNPNGPVGGGSTNIEETGAAGSAAPTAAPAPTKQLISKMTRAQLTAILDANNIYYRSNQALPKLKKLAKPFIK